MFVVLIILGIIGVGAGVIVLTGMSERRVDEEVADTSDWIETEATIQGAGAEQHQGRVSSQFPSVAFSYSIQGEYFSGTVRLKMSKEQFCEQLRTLVNRKFPVQYDPTNPSKWFIAENTIAGYEVISGVDF